ncbi:aminoacyl-tRNA hydrolase [Polaribacter glomeratus]|uniref:Peptidyl-tRNA hydrolase n=2 Tax=Polaribacter glomeratus TaxID=102 RepID=A0A2S7WGF5_9FLAO|nr:aminoacyl-tRNA hydrolase [Polaribacter glomeratus]TXD67459.1 aminoacyl-tRNA hydrolase [Polaribacter glomeratus]
MNLINSFYKIIGIKVETREALMKKFLIVGLGNIGEKYTNTRHNIGFKIVDEVADEHKVVFETDTLGDVATFRFKGKTFVLLKPSTFMNLSGKAVKFWMQKEKITIDNLLVVTDDLNIDFGTLRIKAKGTDGGHNGLKDIQEKLGTSVYPRFRFGISGNFSKGRQVDYVLGEWTKEETSLLIERLPTSAKIITSFGTDGLANTMNAFNGK